MASRKRARSCLDKESHCLDKQSHCLDKESHCLEKHNAIKFAMFCKKQKYPDARKLLQGNSWSLHFWIMVGIAYGKDDLDESFQIQKNDITTHKIFSVKNLQNLLEKLFARIKTEFTQQGMSKMSLFDQRIESSVKIYFGILQHKEFWNEWEFFSWFEILRFIVEASLNGPIKKDYVPNNMEQSNVLNTILGFIYTFLQSSNEFKYVMKKLYLTMANYCSFFFDRPGLFMDPDERFPETSRETCKKLCHSFEKIVSLFISSETPLLTFFESFENHANSFLLCCMEMIDFQLRSKELETYKIVLSIVIRTMARLCNEHALFRIALRNAQESDEYATVLSEYTVNSKNLEIAKTINEILQKLQDTNTDDMKVQIQYLSLQKIKSAEQKEELSEKLKEFNDDMMCEACYENLISTVLVPCGHAALCKKCVEKMQTDTTKPFICVKCRDPPAEVITLYMKVLPK